MGRGRVRLPITLCAAIAVAAISSGGCENGGFDEDSASRVPAELTTDRGSKPSDERGSRGTFKWSADSLRELAGSGASTKVQRDALRAGLRERGISEAQINLVMAHTDDALILWKQDEPSPSWIGGPGLLPAGTTEWPRDGEGIPFTPVARFDLDHLPKLPPPFPQAGILQLYYDFGWVENAPPTFLEAGRAYLLGDEAVELEQPEDDIFRQERIYLDAALMPVAGEPSRVIEEAGGYEEAEKLVGAMNDLTTGLYSHQVGGRAREFQGDVLSEPSYWFDEEASPEFRSRYTEEERTSRDAWQLLATVEAEGEMMFGDGGNLYMIIPKTDLREGRYDRAIGIAQGA